MQGLAKLNRALPSTAFIGNWGILALPSLLDDSLGCRCFMGRGVTTSGPSKGHMDIPISVNDTPAAIAKQWALLREEFSSQSSVLLFHLTNHYALIFAVRDWEDAAGERRQEVLTARRGQRPTQWVSWAEMRDLMLRWAGHKVMVVFKK